MTIAEQRYNQLTVTVKQYSDVAGGSDTLQLAVEATKDVLIQFGNICAADQKKIDIDNACDQLRKLLVSIDFEYSWAENLVNDFKQSLEE